MKLNELFQAVFFILIIMLFIGTNLCVLALEIPSSTPLAKATANKGEYLCPHIENEAVQ